MDLYNLYKFKQIYLEGLRDKLRIDANVVSDLQSDAIEYNHNVEHLVIAINKKLIEAVDLINQLNCLLKELN